MRTPAERERDLGALFRAAEPTGTRGSFLTSYGDELSRLLADFAALDAEIADLRGKAACYDAGVDEHLVYEANMEAANAEIARLTGLGLDQALQAEGELYTLRARLALAEAVVEAAYKLSDVPFSQQGMRAWEPVIAALSAWQEATK
jgi:hypothetical protein